MSIRKIFKSGNSLVISLPQPLLDQADLKEGDYVCIGYEKENKEFILAPLDRLSSPKKQAPKERSRPEEEQPAADFLKHYGDVLKRLDKDEDQT